MAETFVVIWRRLADTEFTSERAWVYGVARRVVLNTWRSKSRSARTETKARWLRADLPVEPDQQALINDASAQVNRALRGLRSSDRELLMLSAWEGLTAPEIADVLGITANAVHQRLHRAKRRLAKRLDKGESRSIPREIGSS